MGGVRERLAGGEAPWKLRLGTLVSLCVHVSPRFHGPSLELSFPSSIAPGHVQAGLSPAPLIPVALGPREHGLGHGVGRTAPAPGTAVSSHLQSESGSPQKSSAEGKTRVNRLVLGLRRCFLLGLPRLGQEGAPVGPISLPSLSAAHLPDQRCPPLP